MPALRWTVDPASVGDGQDDVRAGYAQLDDEDPRIDDGPRSQRGPSEQLATPHCEQLLPMTVSRCRRRQCPGDSEMWARDTMRKIRENLRAYEGLVCMCTLTAPGVAGGLPWDRENCNHSADVTCGRGHGCKVLPAAAALWNEKSRGYWRELNRVCKLRADRAVKRLGHEYKGGLLMYEWELQKRGVWHLHFVLGMETPVAAPPPVGLDE